MSVAFKLQDHVHHVLQDLGACQRTFLGDVAHHEERGARGFRVRGQGGSRFADLTHRPRHAILVRQVQGLNGVDHHKGGFLPPQRVQHSRNLGLRVDQQRRRDGPQSVGPHPDLFRTFLAADVQHLGA